MLFMQGRRGRAHTFMHAYQSNLITELTSSLPPPPRCFSCAHLYAVPHMSQSERLEQANLAGILLSGAKKREHEVASSSFKKA